MTKSKVTTSKSDIKPAIAMQPVSDRVASVLNTAKKEGLINREKEARLSARINSELIARAKKNTGIQTDTELVEFALANLALEDRFPETIKRLQGTIDPDIKIGF